jgi:hypothetical protein
LGLKKIYISLITGLLVLLAGKEAAGQFRVQGYVYDSSRNYAMPAVSVLSTSGKGTFTNGDGYYEIEVSEKDSIWFSYLGKPTVKFPVLKMQNPMGFDISIQVNVKVLGEVKVRPRNYKQDSIQNRQDYAKIFNYEKPKLRPSVTTGGVGFDINEIINMFRFRRNRSMASFQQRLLMDEQEKSITHRFNKALVRRLTQLTGPELDSFMIVFRPSYLFTKYSGEYEFQYYIKQSLYRFKKGMRPEEFIKPEEEQ